MSTTATATAASTSASATDWRDAYLASLYESERQHPVNRDLVAACSALADRVAALEAENAVLQQQQQQQPAPSSKDSKKSKQDPPPPASSSDEASSAATATAGGGAGGAGGASAQARLDLAEALRARGQLEARLRGAEDELRRLRARARADEKKARDLAAERAQLAARLQDRSEELVEKNKMVNRFQDDIVALTMELNLTEQKNQRVAAENKELVDRWMKRMGEEADAMNLQNEPELQSRR